jgi:hypothetical protein
MSIPVRVEIKLNNKTFWGETQLSEEEFNILKDQDRWDLARFLRYQFLNLANGITELIYEDDSVVETVRGEVDPTEETTVIPSISQESLSNDSD